MASLFVASGLLVCTGGCLLLDRFVEDCLELCCHVGGEVSRDIEVSADELA